MAHEQAELSFILAAWGQGGGGEGSMQRKEENSFQGVTECVVVHESRKHSV